MRYQYKNGFSLLELLIAWAIFAITILSLATYQLVSLQRTQQAVWRSMALMQAQNFLESLRMIRSDNLREAELYRWNQINKKILPHGVMRYQCETMKCEVIVSWQIKQQEQKLQLIGAAW